VAKPKRKQICQLVALEYMGGYNLTYEKLKALPNGAELKYGVRTYTKGGKAMEEKLVVSLVGRKKANESKMLRQKKGGTRAAATKEGGIGVQMGGGGQDDDNESIDQTKTMAQSGRRSVQLKKNAKKNTSKGGKEQRKAIQIRRRSVQLQNEMENVDIGQGQKDTGQRPANEIITLTETETGEDILVTIMRSGSMTNRSASSTRMMTLTKLKKKVSWTRMFSS